MITRVATALGRPVTSVAKDPYALTLWTFLQLREDERIAEVLRTQERFDLAGLVALAMHEPNKLQLLERQFRARVGVVPSKEEALSRAAELLRRHAEQTTLVS